MSALSTACTTNSATREIRSLKERYSEVRIAASRP